MASMAAVFTHGPSFRPHLSIADVSKSCQCLLSSHFNGVRRKNNFNGAYLGRRALLSATHLAKSSYFRIRSFQSENAAGSDSASSNDRLLGGVEVNEGLFTDQTDGFSGKGGSFLAKLAIAVGVAATITLVSIGLKQQTPDSSLGIGIQCLADGSSSSSIAASPAGFTFNAFGYKVVLPEYTPGWVYFWLLMAAGCGFFISEEALNIWVGITLARRLCLDGTWQSLAESFSKNAPYISSTVLWVYWGVCISDMIPFYLGKLFRQTGASEDLCSKLGIGKEKLMNITRAVQRYGNLSGFVERFSIGMRNPTAFLAGAVGVPPDCFFAGVCIGGLITLPIQLAIGFLLRERPMFAVASVATVVGIWTIFPYAVAAVTSLYFYLRHKYSSS